MIKIGEDFTLKRDKYNWVLTEYVKGTSKGGLPITTPKHKYYPKLSQACREVVELTLVEGDMLMNLEQTIQYLTENLVDKVESL